MIPRAVLRDRIKIEAYVGTTSDGADSYAAPVDGIPARLVSKSVRRTTPDGVTTIVTDVAQIRPGVEVPPQSKVTCGDRRWLVAEVSVARELSRVHHLDLILDGPL